MKNKTLSNLGLGGLFSLMSAALLVVVPQIAGATKHESDRLVEIESRLESTALTTVAFPYQSTLTFQGQPANGFYDFEFELYDQATGGEQIGPTQTASRVKVDQGLFDTFLDFGPVPNAETVYLEIGIRADGSADSFTLLTPRQTVAAAQLQSVAAVSTVADDLVEPGKSETPAPLAPTAVPGEIWRLGFSTDDTVYWWDARGRALGQAVFRSDRGASNLYYIFPAPAVTATDYKTVQSAKYYIFSRSGGYDSGTANMSLEIYDLNGNLRHTASSQILDLEAATASAWQTVPLTNTLQDKIIANESGEYLAFRVNFDSGSADDFDVRIAFEVEVE